MHQPPAPQKRKQVPIGCARRGFPHQRWDGFAPPIESDRTRRRQRERSPDRSS